MGSRLVFDSDAGRTCPTCEQVLDACSCGGEAALEGDGIVRIRREVRRGKPMTVAEGIPLPAAEVKALAKTLKKKCGVGGSSGPQLIELQGDQREALRTALEQRGFEVRGG